MKKGAVRKISPPRRTHNRKLRFLDPLLVSVPEFSRMAGLGQTLVRQLIADGELPTREIRGRKWILRAEAVEWLRKQVEPSPAA
jgi:hypothetical protein